MTTTTPEEELRRLVLARLDVLVADGFLADETIGCSPTGDGGVRVLDAIAGELVDLVGPLADDVVSAYYGRDPMVPGIDLDGIPAEVVLEPNIFERLRRGETVELPHGREGIGR